MTRLTVLALIALLALVAFPPRFALALQGQEPDDVIVVYNKKAKGSKDVARHYLKARGVPKANLVAVSLPDAQGMDRRHMADLVGPVKKRRDALTKAGRHPLVLLTYGIPLKVTGKTPGISLKKFRKQVAKGHQKARQSAQNAIAGLARVTGSKSANLDEYLTALPDQALLKYGQERAMDASFRLSLAMRSDATADQAWDLRQALKKATGQRLSRKDDGYGLAITFRGIPSKNLGTMAQKTRVAKGAMGEMAFWLGLANVDPNNKADAAVDSELSLALGGDFQIAARLPNPWLPKYDGRLGIDDIRDAVTMVARLDGPTPAIAKRLVDDAMSAEQVGLAGTAYVDARGLDDVGGSQYAKFDQSLRRMARKLKGRLPVVLDNRDRVFSPGSAPDAALYAGWYSMGRYVPAFSWNQGAIGYHAASVEAQGLHQLRGDQWVKRMLESGAAASIGPVMEPFLDSFPAPDRFFPRLLDGENLVTAYYRTLPHLSWRQVLFGDPLYTPFPK